MLLCGFENFENFFIRIDILERLFIQIINSNLENETKLVPEMLNLLGCSKENFLKLLKIMNYKTYKKNDDLYFKYSPKKHKIKKFIEKKTIKDNPFKVLKNINFK